MTDFFREFVLGVFFGPPWRQEPKTQAGAWGVKAALAVWVLLALALVIVTLLLVFD